ncbi:MAG: DUF5103 domain-containing protein [Bacteroidaceae bacterium]|jgi:hypothetical protein
MMIKYLTFILTLCLFPFCSYSQNSEILSPYIKTLLVWVDDDWSRLPVMSLEQGETISIRFDELSPEYRRYAYTIKYCNADWSDSYLSETEYMIGFNGNTIDDYEHSMNTLVEYTHYHLTIPNEDVRITRAGNYEVRIYDEEKGVQEPAVIARFSVVSPKVAIGASVSSNTDIDLNRTHQQVSFHINYKDLSVNDPINEFTVIVRQNNRTDNQVTGLKPSYITSSGLRYEHNRSLIFDAGNEYRRFEMIYYNQAGMGIERIGSYDDYYHATLYADAPRSKYVYDEDQDGAFLIRNSDTRTSVYSPHTESDYLFVHFTFLPEEKDAELQNGEIYLNGFFTHNSLSPEYRLTYNPDAGCYENTQLMKQGYYNYQYLFYPQGTSISGRTAAGKSTLAPTEGNFYETENEYQIYVYHRGFGQRCDELVGFTQIKTLE